MFGKIRSERMSLIGRIKCSYAVVQSEKWRQLIISSEVKFSNPSTGFYSLIAISRKKLS